MESYYGDELARLRDELKLISDELSLSKSQVRQSRVQLSECQTEQLSAQLQNTRVTREKDLLEIRLSSVENLLNVKSIDYLQYISQSSNAQNDLEYTISSLTADLNKEKKKSATLSDNYSILEEKFDEVLLEKGVSDARLIEQQTASAREIQDACRMRDLYKRFFEEMRTKFEDLETRAGEDRAAYEQYVEVLHQQQHSVTEDAQLLMARQRAEMQAKISELEQQVQDAASDAANASSLNRSAASVTTIPDEFSDMMMTGKVAARDLDVSGLYNRAVLYEKRYLDERNRCIDLQTYLQQQQQSHALELSTVAEQLSDYSRLSKAYSELGGRMEAALAHGEQLQAQLAALAPRASEGELQSALLQQQNRDLSRQLQHVLLRSQGASALPTSAAHERSANDVISAKLLTFDDVAQLQLRNSQLLQALRALSADQGDRLGEDLETDAFAQQLLGSAAREKSRQVRELAAELEHSRAELVQAEETIDRLMLQAQSYQETLSQSAADSSSPRGADSSTSKAARALRAKVSALEEEVAALRDERDSSVIAEQEAAAAAEDLRRECSELRASAARESSAARLMQERQQRVAEAHRNSAAEAAGVVMRLAEKEKEAFDLSRRLRSSEERAFRAVDQASAAGEQLQQTRSELEATRAAEQQLISRLVVNQDLLQKHVLLVESMQRIETGMQSKEKEQLESVMHERDALLKSCKGLRSELDAKELGHDQRCRQQDQELAATRGRLDAVSADLSSTRERLLREQSASRLAQARSVVLEKQNTIALERLGVLQGVPLESFDRPDLQAKELELERAAVQVESLQQQLTLAEKHLGELHAISAAAEQQAREAEQQLTVMAAQRMDEEQRARQELLRLSELEHALQGKEREHEAEKERLRSRAAQLEEESAEQAREAESLRQRLAEGQGYVDIFKAEMRKFQQTAKAAYASYEKEVAARQELEAKAGAQVAEQAALREELQKLRSLELDESAAKSAQHGASEQLEGLRRVNDLLHGQVQSLGMQLDRAREQAGASVDSGRNRDRDAGDSMKEEEEEESELGGARRCAQELREVVRYIKREKESAEARLVSQEAEALHLKGALTASHRQLEEARVELKRERERSYGGWSRGDQFDRLMVEITQNNIVRESNAKLRQQNEGLQLRVAAMEVELSEASAGSLPLRQELQRVRLDKEALEVGLRDKTEVVLTLHRRLQQLLARYEAVDPEIHRSLLSELNEINSAATVARSEAAAKESEMIQIRQRHGSLEASQTKLRNKLREVLSQVDDLRKEKSEVEARRGESDERSDRLLRELSSSSARLEAAQGELEAANAQVEELSRQAADEHRSSDAAARELEECRKELAQLREEAAAGEAQDETAAAASSSATISKITSKKRKEALEDNTSPVRPATAANPLKSIKDRLFELQAARKNSIDKEKDAPAAERAPEAKKAKVQPASPAQVQVAAFNPFAPAAKLSASAVPFRPSAAASPFNPFSTLAAASAAASAAEGKDRAKAQRAQRFGLPAPSIEPNREDGEEDDAEEQEEEEEDDVADGIGSSEGEAGEEEDV